jgi:DNA-binding NtrC family response regulator
VLARQVSRREEADVTEALTSAATALVQGGRMNLSEILDEFEAVILREALQRLQSTHAGLADRLGLSRRTFYHKLRKHHLTTSRWTLSSDQPLK